jgi:hypothetical protein
MRQLLLFACVPLAFAACDGSSSSLDGVSGTDGDGGVVHGGNATDGGSSQGGGEGGITPLVDGGCSGGQVACGGGCVNTQTDNANCGICGHACTTGFACAAGACASSATCPAPTGAPADATKALTESNALRAKIGSPCAVIAPALDTSATKHCAYYKANAGQAMCISNPHVEVMTCTQFVAAQFYDRMAAAGYGGQPASEDMAFVGDPQQAVGQWIDSVWHRPPLLSPWVRDFGYGSATGCDTADFGVGAGTPDTVVATYPYDGQTSVPTKFSGAEGPTPPAPPTGFPSGYPIHVFLKNGAITVHTLTLDGDTTAIPHVFFGPNDPQSMGFLRDAYVMYAHKPLTPGKRYRVHVTGTQGAKPVTLDWTFTTQ